ncbi:TPA: hypothetical protein ACH3X3_000117 [Trebouxia sp. C0006]
MEVDEAHKLYQQFQKVDAAAKQKQGLGFGASSPPRPDTELPKPSNGWEAPYKLSDKYQQPETNSRKRSRSPSHHKSHSEVGKRRRSRPASRSPPSPSRGISKAHKAKRSRRSDSREPERHDQTHKYHSEDPHDRTRRSRSHQSPHRHSHSSRGGERSRRHHSSHSSRQDSSRHDSRHRSRHDRARSRSRDQRSSRQQHVSLEADRHRRSDTSHRSSSRSKSRDKDRRRRDKDSRSRQEDKADKAPDYATLITGYNSMGPTERLKAVTQYKLRKTSSKEPNGANGKPWTRFVFNNAALLDEEGAVPDGPGFEGSGQAGLGAFDFRQHRSVQPALPAEDAHEAAIFGAPAAQVPSGDDPLRRPAHAASSDSDERPQVAKLHEITAFGDDADPPDAVEPSTAPQPKLSWRERALLKKQQAEGS